MNVVVISGIGVVSPLGTSAHELAHRFCAGETAIRSLTALGIHDVDAATVDSITLDVIPADKRTRVGRLDRLCRLLLSAAYLAVDAAQLDMSPADSDRVGLSFGTGLGCLLTNAEYYEKIVAQGPAAASPRLFAYTVSSAAAGEVSIALGIRGANVTAHAGLAAGLQAIGYGLDLIRMGKADVVLAGGADALGPALVNGLRDMGLLKPPGSARAFRDAIPGVCPAEGAVVAVLERGDRARARGARCLARIEGYAAGFEPTLTRSQREPTAIVATMRRALAAADRRPTDVGFVMTSAHGTPVDATEQAALDQVFDREPGPLLFAPKAAWGESFAADGAQALALAAALLNSAPQLADGVAYDLDGTPLAANVARPRLATAQVAMVHSLCYSGPTVALLLAREE